MVIKGHRAAMLYLVNRTDCERFAIAGDINKEHRMNFVKATHGGVEILCYGTPISPTEVALSRQLPLSQNEK